MKKCIRLIALLMACVLCLAACGQSGSSSAAPASSAAAPAGSAPETGDRPLKIGVTLVNLNIPHWVNMEWEYQQMAKETGHELTFVHAEGYENVEKQINQIQDFIAAGMDAIIVAATDAEAVVKAIDEAVAAGIPVIEVNNLSNSDKSYIKIKSDDYEMGALQAKLMNEALGGEGKVVMINAPGGTTLAIRGQGFRETVEKDYPGIEILAEQFVASDPVKCTAAMEDFLQTYPEIDGVFCWSETAGVTAASVVSTQQKDIVVTCMDITNSDVRSGIRSGSIYGTIAQQPITLAQLSFEYAVKAAKGEPAEQELLYAPIATVTTDNIDTTDFSGILRPDETI